ncbi:MAG TPA: hypothetical protein VF310_14565 [Vicinamibacteria bacterium]|jgi:hypothetical protein
MKSLRPAWVVLVLTVVAVSAAATLYSQTRRRGLTEAQAKEIHDLFVGDDAASYRLSLPVFEGGKATRSEVYGTLPLDRVRQIAVRKNLPLRGDVQVHAVIIQGTGGDGGKGGSGGQGGTGGVSGTAGGSMQTTPTNKIERLKQILRGLDQRRYQLLVEEAPAAK